MVTNPVPCFTGLREGQMSRYWHTLKLGGEGSPLSPLTWLTWNIASPDLPKATLLPTREEKVAKGKRDVKEIHGSPNDTDAVPGCGVNLGLTWYISWLGLV